MKLLSKHLFVIFLISLFAACGGGGGGGSSEPTNEDSNQETPSTGNESPEDPEEGETLFVDTTDFSSTDDFIDNLISLELIEDSDTRLNLLNTYWGRLRSEGRIPFVAQDGVVFVYRNSSATSVVATGDWNWFEGLDHAQSNASSAVVLGKVEGTNLWYAKESFASDARLDYKYIVNSEYKLDPMNENIQLGGYGDNSYFAMPDYQPAAYKKSRESVLKGQLGASSTIASTELGYNIKYSVYTPYNYASYSDLPTVYFLDGFLYSNALMGAAVITLNNMIADQIIPPVIAVFVDSSDATTSASKRVEQYLDTPEITANFLKNELVPRIDAGYSTSTNRSDRNVIGVSHGGAFATYLCFVENSVFGNCGAQSPEVLHSETLAVIEDATVLLDVDVALATGNIGDVVSTAQSYRDTLESNGYALSYQESSQGHSWGNWSDSLPNILVQLLND